MKETTYLRTLLQFSIVYIIGCILYYYNNYMAALCFLIYSFYILFYMYKFNKFLSYIHLYIFINMFILGLQALHLLEYQKVIMTEFFILNYLGIFFLSIGVILGSKIDVKFKHISLFSKSSISLNKIYYLVVICTIIAVISFCISTYLTGVIAFFSNSTSAYQTKYTKFLIVEVAMLPSAGLAYYCFKRKELKFLRRFIMLCCFFIHIIILPILNVSRGVMMTGIVAIFPVIYTFSVNKKRIMQFLFLGISIVFLTITNSRNYSDEYLNYYFTGRKIQYNQDTFSIQGNAAFIYGYLTISNDNFNYNINKLQNFSFGARTLQPINTIIKNKKLDQMVENSKLELVFSGLTTHSSIGYTYYDLGLVGVIMLNFLYGSIYGIIARKYYKYKSPIICMLYGSCLINIILGFFSNWMMNFDWWLWVIMDIFLLLILKVKIHSTK